MKITKEELLKIVREELGSLLSEEEKREVQDEYVAEINLAIRQDKDIDRTKVLNFIRSIPNVTTIRREKEISTSENSFVGEFSLRIVLPHGQSIKKYVDNVLKPSIRDIDGVGLQAISNLEKVN